MLSVVLSLQLVLIMLCGTALELNRLTAVQEQGSDVYEENAFWALTYVFTSIISLTAVVALVISIPCLRDKIVV